MGMKNGDFVVFKRTGLPETEKEVKILRVLPSEDSMMDGDTLLIMDMLAEAEDGALINIEIQKQSYAFPAERMSCYSADLVMRQYARVKGKRRKELQKSSKRRLLNRMRLLKNKNIAR